MKTLVLFLFVLILSSCQNETDLVNSTENISLRNNSSTQLLDNYINNLNALSYEIISNYPDLLISDIETCINGDLIIPICFPNIQNSSLITEYEQSINLLINNYIENHNDPYQILMNDINNHQYNITNNELLVPMASSNNPCTESFDQAVQIIEARSDALTYFFGHKVGGLYDSVAKLVALDNWCDCMEETYGVGC